MSGRALLTRNQRQVLDLMADGKTARDIAAEFEVSRTAVEGTQMRMRQRLGARTNVQLMVRCFELGIIAPPERPPANKPG
jgi:DNA-binding CsgD family transcriptional regulator